MNTLENDFKRPATLRRRAPLPLLFSLGIGLTAILTFLSISSCSKNTATLSQSTVCDETGMTLNLPFNYTVGNDHLLLTNSNAKQIKVSLGPWGAHVMPFTGHPNGNAKTDMQGVYAWTLNELTELTPSNGNGICEEQETCGLPESQLLDRAPEYVAPSNHFKITKVQLVTLHPEGHYYSSNQQWFIDGELCSHVYGFGHLRKIGEALRNKMVQAGYTDPWSVTALADNLITGPAIELNAGELIAHPQIVADPVVGHAGYFTGKWSNVSTPWNQIEWGTRTGSISEPVYAWVSNSLRESLSAAFSADVSNLKSMRYRGYNTDNHWLWKSEATLYTTTSTFMEQYDTIFKNLGGWTETTDVGKCTTGEAKCDSLFVIFPISRSSQFYDPNLYSSSSVSYLATLKFPATQKTTYGEVIDPAEPNSTSGLLTVKWRPQYDAVTYQKLRYTLYTASKILKIRWSNIAPSVDQLSEPKEIAAADMCDGETLTCHDHEFRGD